MLSGMWENNLIHCQCGIGCQSGKKLDVFFKNYPYSYYITRNRTPEHLFQRNKNLPCKATILQKFFFKSLCPHKNVYTNIYNNFIWDSSRLETTQFIQLHSFNFNEWTFKLLYVHAIKRNKLPDAITCMNVQGIMLRKRKKKSPKVTCYVTLYVTFKQINGCQGLRREWGGW